MHRALQPPHRPLWAASFATLAAVLLAGRADAQGAPIGTDDSALFSTWQLNFTNS